MQHPDEGTIHAWLDGALSADEARALEAHVAGCAQCAAVVTEARGLLAASSRILSALDSVPGGVLPAADPEIDDGRQVVPIRRTPRWYSPRWRSAGWRAAAAIVLVGSVSWLATRSTRGSRDTITANAPPPASAAANTVAAAPAMARIADTMAQVTRQSGATAARPAPRHQPTRADDGPARSGATLDATKQRVAEAPPQVVAAVPSAIPYAAPRPAAVPNVMAGDMSRRAQVGSVAAGAGAGAEAGATERNAAASSMRAKVSAPSAPAGRLALRESAPAPSASERLLVGCYSLETDAARSASAAAARIAGLIPARVELVPSLDPLAGSEEGERRVIRAAAGAAPFVAGTRATWSTISADSVLFEISDATRSLSARLEVKGDSVSGRATIAGPSVEGGSMITGVRGRRIACSPQ